MRLSSRARYALLLMLDVARHGGQHSPVSLAAIATRTDLSRGYLEQLAMTLRNARMLRAVSGRKGGYLLGRSGTEITVGDVFDVVIGPTAVARCVEDPDSCSRSVSCQCRLLYALINQRIGEVLHHHTLADLLDPSWMQTVSQQLVTVACAGPPSDARLSSSTESIETVESDPCPEAGSRGQVAEPGEP